MRWGWALLLAVGGSTLAGSARAQENRLWYADVELEGPLEEVLLTLGSAGTTRLRTALVAGERRRLAVPVPARVPLGVAALAGQPAPELERKGPGSAVWRGWSTDQPTTRIDALVGLTSRPRPPVEFPVDEPGSTLAAAALALAAFVVAFGLRRRPRRALAAGSLGGLAAFGATCLPGDLEPRTVQLLEATVGVAEGLRITGARDELPLPGGRLEVRPAGRALELDLRLEEGRLTGRVRCAGALLYGLETGPAPELRSARNGFQALDWIWVREAGGSWSGRGPWDAGAPLPRAGAAEGTALLPGWLSAGLPPGPGVLVGRIARSGDWIRVVGFRERD